MSEQPRRLRTSLDGSYQVDIPYTLEALQKALSFLTWLEDEIKKNPVKDPEITTTWVTYQEKTLVKERKQT